MDEARLVDLVLNGVTSPHSRRAYAKGLADFFAWVRAAYPVVPAFSKAERGLSSATINLRLSPVRKLAREMADNGLLDPAIAAAIERAKGVERRGVRAGNWLIKDQANELLQAPSDKTLKGKRNRAILSAPCLWSSPRRARRPYRRPAAATRGCWVIPDLEGKGDRIRTVPIPAPLKVRIDDWLRASEITEGRLFRAVNKGDTLVGQGLADEKAIWRIVTEYAQQTSLGKLAPHDLRRTCAKLCRKAGGNLEQIQLLLGHASIATTQRYLGTELELAVAVNDGLGLEI